MKKFFQNNLVQARRWYGDKKNTTGTLLIDHVTEVAELIHDVSRYSDELNDDVDVLCKIALAHDLLEDTGVDAQELEGAWGKDVTQGVIELSNKRGDSDFSEYIEYLVHDAHESSRIVKLADILANVNNSLRHVDSIDPVWIKTFWLPLLETYKRNLFLLSYPRFPKTAKWFVDQIEAKMMKLAHQ